MLTQTKIIIFLLILMGGLGYFTYSEVQRHGETKKELETSEMRVNSLQDSIYALEEDRKEIESEVRKLTEDTTKQKRELASLRDREDIVVAKPGLVELKINKSFNKTQERLACITGDTKLCVN